MQKKSTELLKYLMAQNKPQTSTEIANALSISVRSVKKHVKDINTLYNKKIVLSSRNGYQINSQISSSLIIEENEDIPQTWEERAFYIIKQLILEHTSRLDLFELCDSLCLGYSTVKTVIYRMNKAFASYQVEFICENDCVLIKGKEKDKRRLISYVINEESKTSFVDIHQLKEYFTDVDIDKLNQIVTINFRKNNMYLNDFAAVNLILQMAILIDRERNGKPLESDSADFTTARAAEKQLVDSLCNEIEDNFHISLNQYERFEIYMLIKATANYAVPTAKGNLKHIIGDEFLELTDYYIEQINNLYMLDLSNESFVVPFCLHLKNLLFRAKANCPTSNPMAESLKHSSPIIFDMAIFIGLDLMDRYQITITEDEIGFLAIHIGAEIERQNANSSKVPVILLCPDYRDMCMELSNKIMLSFGNQIKLVGIVHNEEELEKLESETKDIRFKVLFTTIPLLKKYNYTVVSISPFNLTSQYDIIQDALFKNTAMLSNHKLRSFFHSFFEEELFWANPVSTTREDVLSCLCAKLYEKNYTNDDFEQKVLKRENAATTAFNNIAIPHSVDMDAIKTSIAVAVSKKGFQWGTNTVHLVLLLAINKADKRNFRLLYESLISLFGEDYMIQEVRNCKTFQDFEALIYNNIDEPLP